MQHFFDHFSEPVPTAYGLWLSTVISKKIYGYLSDSLKEGTSVLEIGPGRGDFASVCIKNRIKYFCIEPNDLMATQLEKLGAKKVVRELAPPIRFNDEQFDVVFYKDVYEHMGSYEKAMEMITESLRVLKKGGILAISSPEITSWKEEFFNADFTHNHPTSSRRVIQTFWNFGVKVKKSTYISGPFFGNAAIVAEWISGILIHPRLYSVLTLGLVSPDLFYKVKLNFLLKFLTVGIKP